MSTWDENAYIATDTVSAFYRKILFCYKFLFFFKSGFSTVPEYIPTNILCSYLMHLGQQAVPEGLKKKELTIHLLEQSFHAAILVSQILLFKSHVYKSKWHRGLWALLPVLKSWEREGTSFYHWQKNANSKQFSSKQQHNCCTFAIISNYSEILVPVQSMTKPSLICS